MNLKLLDGFSRGPRKRFDDVSLSAFVENELKAIVPTLYDRLFPELDARLHIPISTNINPGAMSWAYDSFDKRGQAIFIGANVTEVPRADVSKQRLTFPIRGIASSYGWSIEEMEAAQFSGTQLDRMKAEAARRAIAELENTTLLFGQANHNLPGFLNNAATPIVTVPNGAWLTTATADQILNDMNAVTDQVYVASNKTHRPNTMLLPLAHYRLVQTRRLPDTNISIMQYFMNSNGFIREVLPLLELGTAGPSGAPRMLVYEKDPRNLAGIVPLPFQQLEPQVRGFEVVVHVREKVGGTVWFYPMSGAFGDGI